MPRIHIVKKSRKPKTCGNCHEAIPVGSPYKWTQLKTGPRSSLKKVRCMKAVCNFKASDLTTSDKLGRLYDSRDAIQLACQKLTTSGMTWRMPGQPWKTFSQPWNLKLNLSGKLLMNIMNRLTIKNNISRGLP